MEQLEDFYPGKADLLNRANRFSDYAQDESNKAYKANLQKAIDFGIQFKPGLDLDYIASKVYRYGENIFGILPVTERPDPKPLKFNKCKYVNGIDSVKAEIKIGQIIEFDYWLSDNEIDLGVLVGVEFIFFNEDLEQRTELDDSSLSYLVVPLSEIYDGGNSDYEELASDSIKKFEDRYLFHPPKPKFFIGQLVEDEEGYKAVVLGVKWCFQAHIDSLIRNPEQVAEWSYFIYSWDFEQNIMIDIIGLVKEHELKAA